MRRLMGLLLCGVVGIGINGWAQHQHHDSGHEAPPAFGHLHFPTSCSADVQHDFEMAVAELHSFEYTTAEKQFHAVAEKDPQCAIAFWGESMALYHQIWDTPSKQILTEGWDFVQKAKAAKETSPRETGYVEAMAVFYKPGEQTSEERTSAYSEAMNKLHEQYPDDEEAAIFYALSLLAAEPPDDTSLAYPKKAVAILNSVLAKDPDHPGVTHYLIHACDNPHMAQDGLAAARHYAAIAPSSAHAVHMPSHIFARLGLWQESIQSNIAAVEVAKRENESAEYSTHPMDYMMYAYLQTGQDDKARAVSAQALEMPKSEYSRSEGFFYYYVQAHFPAMLDVELKDWKAAEALQANPDARPGIREITFWAQAVGAGRLKDVEAAKKAVNEYEAADAEDLKANPKRVRPPLDTDLNEAKAWAQFAQGHYDDAFALLKPVIDRQDAVGKGEVELPAREMYADMLLEANRPKEALEQYQLSLKTDPNRFNALYGAGRAAEMTEQHDVAVNYYKQLLINCKDAGPQRPELAHAKSVVGLVENAKN